MKAYKTRLEPNNEQRGFFRQCAGASRYVYNWALAEWDRQYKLSRHNRLFVRPSAYSLKAQFNAEKSEMCPWILELPAAVSEAAILNLGTAFSNYFRKMKNGELAGLKRKKSDYFPPGHPKFKSRYRDMSFQLRGVKVKSDRVYIPKLGWVRLSERDYIPTDAVYGTYATISERAGHWYISVLVKDKPDMVVTLNNNIIGIDFGISSLAVLSNGKVFENPHHLKNAQRKLKRLQRELARRQKGSNRREDTRRRLAKAHAAVVDARRYTLHQVSEYVTRECKPSAIVIEGLNVSGMTKNHKLAAAILDVGFGELRRQIEYKAATLGIRVIVADTFFPSSKTCSRCGCIKDTLSLSERVFVCADCGFEIDRDLNAAKNLEALGHLILNREAHGDCAGS